MKKVITKIILGVLILPFFFGAFFVAQKASAATPTIQIEQISIDETNNEARPRIYGDKIVWENDSTGIPEIYMYNLGNDTETNISNDISYEYWPDISENYVVWENWGTPPYDIFAYNLQTEQLVTSIGGTARDHRYPAVSGSKVVWRDFNGDIYSYDIQTLQETRITTSGNAWFPDIDENKIVWEETRSGNKDIYLFDLESNQETRITTNSDDQVFPRIFEDKIVWLENGVARNIFMYNLTTQTQTQITNSGTITIPVNRPGHDIYDSKIVYEDTRPENGDVTALYVYDLLTLTETKITDLENDDTVEPSIYGVSKYNYRVVWSEEGRGWVDPDPWSKNIYMATLTFPDETAPTFQNLPSSSSSINITEGQTITTNPFNIQVKPVDDVAVSKTEFFVDNNLICTVTSADGNGVYSCPWDTSLYHSAITVYAYDNSNNKSTALTRNASVLLTAASAGSVETLPKTGIPFYFYVILLLVIFEISFVVLTRKNEKRKYYN